MRIGAWLDETALDTPSSADMVAAAERAGLFGILVDSVVDWAVGIVTAAEVAVTTTDPLVVVRILLGSEHPVTLAEEIAVLDQLSAGRVVCIMDTGSLRAEEALEDLTVLRASWSGRIFRYQGKRWTVPSGLLGVDMPGEISVTPKPAQLDIPVWLAGSCATELRQLTGLPLLASDFGEIDPAAQVQPALAVLSGDLDSDRALVAAWSGAGATHLLVGPPVGTDVGFLPGFVARYLQPEVAMPYFPRVMASAALPDPWVPR